MAKKGIIPCDHLDVVFWSCRRHHAVHIHFDVGNATHPKHNVLLNQQSQHNRIVVSMLERRKRRGKCLKGPSEDAISMEVAG